ncbi:MAG: hypothetical protein KKB31_04675 [Nanoarchaeota archaeon]|nr:hypothetical protein [Nanoarchaeota archaeon]
MKLKLDLYQARYLLDPKEKSSLNVLHYSFGASNRRVASQHTKDHGLSIGDHLGWSVGYPNYLGVVPKKVGHIKLDKSELTPEQIHSLREGRAVFTSNGIEKVVLH